MDAPAIECRICARSFLLLKPEAHFIIVKRARVGLNDSFRNSGAEAIPGFDQTQGRFLYEMLGVHPVVGRDARKLRFLLWRETDFHS